MHVPLWTDKTALVSNLAWLKNIVEHDFVPQHGSKTRKALKTKGKVNLKLEDYKLTRRCATV